MEKDFLELIKHNSGIIYKVAYIYQSKENILDDLYQEIVLNLWKAFPNFRSESSSSTWIYRIALNTCITFFRKSSRRPNYVELSPEMKSMTDDRYTYIKELYTLINKLNNLERALILLYLEQRPHKEIAEIIGISPSNVSTRINRIKEKLMNLSNQ